MEKADLPAETESGSQNTAPERASAPVLGSRPAVRSAAGGFLVLLLAFLVTACGSGGKGNSNGQGSSGGQSNSNAQTVQVKVEQGQGGAVLVLVPVYINDQGPYTFVLDTGASASAIDAKLVDQLHLPVVGRAGAVMGIGGTQRARLVKVDKWRVGNVSLPASVVTDIVLGSQTTQGSFAGLLGSDVLSQFGTVTIDYKKQEMTLGPK